MTPPETGRPPAQRDRAGDRRPTRQALLWLVFLGPFFFLTYGYANHYSSALPRVGSFVYGWEQDLPFWPWTILPYMSIDVFYAISLFVCTSRAELRTHASRLLAATLVSVAFFLLFPLRFSFPRPATSGFNGWLFDLLTGFDLPFNQAPSLHISLLLILWTCYARHARGAWRWLLHGWFALIGISVLTTYQHHFIDVWTGAAVGILCLYLLPGAPWTLRFGRGEGRATPVGGADEADLARRRKLARRYAQACAIFLLLAVAAARADWMTASLLLCWPAFSLTMVALAYAGQGVRVFQKQDGRMRWPARWALAPYLLAAWVSSRLYTLRVPPYVEVYPGVWIGRAPSTRDLRRGGFTAVVDLAAEFPARPAALRLDYTQVSMLDLVVPTPSQLTAAAAAIAAAAGTVPGNTSGGGSRLLVHCALGYSRSALAIAAWRALRGDDPEWVIEQLRAHRAIVISPSARQSLQEIARSRGTRTMQQQPAENSAHARSTEGITKTGLLE
ncbi:phosphatase PAP2/dual specificity phosphatase family protein [Bordetella sp. LUAb4]|uniref:phosphatase PAP2/dual specificity phosphatase family protein n=1 Tax=Bordetella sp. LUAb4 TaxID=2843195 RepID=UPI001E37D83F|nr:phosphatase PAP2/dual specificity phosphatase family protein [Bordetella sp. LUAb4]